MLRLNSYGSICFNECCALCTVQVLVRHGGRLQGVGRGQTAEQRGKEDVLPPLHPDHAIQHCRRSQANAALVE